MRTKIVKWVKYFDDGTSEFIEGEDAENYNHNIDVANGLIASRSYIKMKPVKWKPNE